MLESEKQKEFNDYYIKKDNAQVKWFEPYIQPKMLDEWNNQTLKKGISLLDVGGGFSFDNIFYASNGLQTTVLDYSKEALNKMKDLAAFYNLDIKCICGSILEPPKEMHSQFDVVTDNGCFHHIDPPDRSKYFTSVFSLLKKGGILYIRAMSEYVPPSTDNFLRAYRISSDDIICQEVMKNFKLLEMSLFDYVLNVRGRQKIWFIKLQRR